MFTFATLVRWLHLVALIGWLGGWCFLAFLTGRMEAEARALLARRFQVLSWELAGVLVLTGLFNLMTVGYGRDFAYSGAYLRALGIKMLLFALVLVLQGLYTHRFLLHTPNSRAPLLVAILGLSLAAVAVYLGLGLPYL